MPRDVATALRSQSTDARVAAVKALGLIYAEKPESLLAVSAYIELAGLTRDAEASIRTAAMEELADIAADLRQHDPRRLRDFHAELRSAYRDQSEIELLAVSLEAPAKPVLPPPQPVVARPQTEVRPFQHPDSSGGGMGFVASVMGHRSHDIVVKGIQLLINLTERSATGPDPESGDGAGVLIQIPHAFFEAECRKLGFTLPDAGQYGVGMVFLPVEPSERLTCEAIVERIAHEEGLTVLERV